ncbi:MAG: glucose-6-phosphate isomerase [Bacteroidetes bacterium HGW-Bacteroidetes-4]|nr:MAG: glucose-6-phosphate isomerase [Bacteroidetes bacterium HGW-Bacteroidetes-4]
MGNILLDTSKTLDFVSKEEVQAYAVEAKAHLEALYQKTGKGSDFLGWVKLPTSITFEELKDIQQTAARFKKDCEVVVVIGIGGSYLGAKAVIDALSDNFVQLKERKNPLVVFAGQNISEDYMTELRSMLHGRNWGIVVISKSGTTTEPAIAFRILKTDLEKKYSKEGASQRIVAITDASKGALRTLATREGYKTYVIPDDVGGRYSVLTPVGLLPIAIAGFELGALVKGAADMEKLTAPEVPFQENPAAIYAATRNALLRSGKDIEIMVNYNPKLHYFAEWWKQLYGESEGKDGKGIFPASVDFTSDLHSMGQYIQEGRRALFETVLSIAQPNNKMVIDTDEANLDGLNFLAGKRMDEVNKMAELGTIIAHVDGGVPNIRIELPLLNEYYLGQLIYFYEIACGISGYLLGVNPFDQPGVEAYKKNMFALLEKPGFENETKAIKARL